MKRMYIVILFMIVIVGIAFVIFKKNNLNSFEDKNKIFLIEALKVENDIVQNNLSNDLNNEMNNYLPGLYEKDGNYYFRGNVDNNYVILGDMLWRIISFNDQKMRLVSENGLANNKRIAFHNTDYIISYEESNLREKLENWFVSFFLDVSVDVVSVDILTYDDVVNAGGTELYNNEYLYLCNGFDTWLSTKKEDNLLMESSLIWYLSSDGMLDVAFVEEFKTIRPVITINNLEVLSGSGTITSPYLLS